MHAGPSTTHKTEEFMNLLPDIFLKVAEHKAGAAAVVVEKVWISSYVHPLVVVGEAGAGIALRLKNSAD